MRKKAPKASYLRYRIIGFSGIFVLCFVAVLFRAFQLQVLENKALKRMAARQHSKTISVEPKRGDIYDRNLKELAVSIEVDSVYAAPSKIESPEDAARELSRILSMDRAELEKKLKSPGGFVWLRRQVDLKEEDRRRIAEIDGIGIVKESRRYYPNRQLAANLVGFTGLDSNGLEGVELYYDSMLKGSAYKLSSDKDAAGRLIYYEDLEKAAPAKGMVVELTIDKTIQYITEKALKKAVEESGAKSGTALVMDPMTGEVLAMAAVPTYDPNDIGGYTAREWRNRPITDVFEPGSVFKLFIISAALEENVIKPTDVYYCENGSYRVADRTFHDAERHGYLTVPQIIKVSSNIGAAKVGEKLGRSQLYRYLKAYGFGSKTGIDLPGETSGSLRNYKQWSSVTLETVSFGQGVSATGLQLVTALSAVANGGFMMKPYIVRSIKDPNGNVVAEHNPAIVRRVVSEATARKMTEMLIGVTTPGGTGTRAALDGFEVAGKTGTAQKPDFKNGGYVPGAFMSSFFGFVPARSPRLAVIVAIDEPRGDYHGGTVAAPVFREIAGQSLSYLGVYPQGRSGMPSVQMAKAAAEAAAVEPSQPAVDENIGPMAVPDFRGKTMRSVIKIARSRSFDVNVIGSGKAVTQKPAPGQSVPDKGPVVVWFQ